jgi:hypothetical protein
MKYLYLTILILGTFAAVPAAAQKSQDKKIIQLSGVIKEKENLPVPFTLVKIKNTTRGTIAGVDGFYSLAVAEKDTIEFDAVNYNNELFIVPTNIPDKKYTKNIFLVPTDTLERLSLDTVPWKTEEEFKQAFLSLKLEDTPADNAKKNLDQQKLMELYETLARDGREQQIYTLQAIASSYYYAGGQKNYVMMGGTPVPTSLLNPFAWVKFVDALKKGKFKKEEAKE